MFVLCAGYTLIAVYIYCIAIAGTYNDGKCNIDNAIYIILYWSTFPVFGFAAAIFCLLGANADYPEIHMAIHFILVRKYHHPSHYQ